MALLKNYHPFRGPKGLKLYDLFKKFDKTWALTKKSETKYGRTSPERTYEDAMKRRQSDPWNFLFIAGMWFQDLFNYDFRRTEMCIIPYATQQGEISFCAYNTGVGWRQIIENMHKNATVAEWYKNHGKHEIYAKGKNVSLESYEHSLKIDAEDAARVRHLEHDVPLTAAEEERARRKKAYEEQAKVRAIYDSRADRHGAGHRQGSAGELQARYHRPSQWQWEWFFSQDQRKNGRSRRRRLSSFLPTPQFQVAPVHPGPLFCRELLG